MKKDKDHFETSSLPRVASILLGLPWIEIAAEAWKLGRKIFRGWAEEGMYEVLEYESILELHDKGGKQATFMKRKKVRYLQNNIIAYQDYGWGEGKYFHDYQAKPGIPVDRYNIGYKTYILLSLREVKNKGDVDEFHIQWRIEDGFLKPDGFWETDISSRTKHMKVSVIFPKSRPPLSARLVETNIRRTMILEKDAIQQLPDGRWLATWEEHKPRLFEHYIIRWDW